jgi:hypothetical protein
MRVVPNNTHLYRWIDSEGSTAWPPLLPGFNPLDSDLWEHFCMQPLLTTKRHFNITVWLPIRLAETTLASLNR